MRPLLGAIVAMIKASEMKLKALTVSEVNIQRHFRTDDDNSLLPVSDVI